jgi:hypothetical protein
LKKKSISSNQQKKKQPFIPLSPRMQKKSTHGTITAINGVVVDVHFPHQLPHQYDALLVASSNAQGETVIIETLQILEDNIVR